MISPQTFAAGPVERRQVALRRKPGIHRLVPMDRRLRYQRFRRQPPYGPRCRRGPHPPRAGTICAVAAFATVSPAATGIADTMSGNIRQKISEAMNAM
jgi:hypothetical protein